LKWWWSNAYLSVNKSTQLFVDYEQQMWWITLNQPTSNIKAGLNLGQVRPSYSTIASFFLGPYIFLQAGDNVTTIYRFLPGASKRSQVDRLDIQTETAQTTRFGRTSVPGQVWAWVYLYDSQNPTFGLWLLGDSQTSFPSSNSKVKINRR